MRRLRGKKMAMIFQDPLSAMHPYYTVGHQIVEAYRVHNDVSKRAARAQAVEMLDRVGIPEPDRRVDAYPHQFSGGMRQRAMIAMALSCNPDLLIADEPTTALDVTVQAQILDLIRDLQKEFNSAIIIITHDLGVVAEIADDMMVMYAGRAAEYGTAEQIFDEPEHPYTWGLLQLDAAAGPGPQRAAAPDPRHAAEPDPRAAGLPVPPALRATRTRRTGSPTPSVPSSWTPATGTSWPATCRRPAAASCGARRSGRCSSRCPTPPSVRPEEAAR